MYLEKWSKIILKVKENAKNALTKKRKKINVKFFICNEKILNVLHYYNTTYVIRWIICKHICMMGKIF